MHKPENQRGWRETVEVAGRKVVVTAMHRDHRRMPRGSEIVKQMSRGRPMEMVEEKEFSWMITAPEIRSVFVRRSGNGMYTVENRSPASRDIISAVRSYCEQRYAAIDAIKVERAAAAENPYPRVHRDPEERLAAVPVELTDVDVREILHSVNRKTSEDRLDEGLLPEIHRAILFNSARHPVTAIIAPEQVFTDDDEEEAKPPTP